MGLEDPVLLGGAQTRVQGNHLNGTRRARAAVGRVARPQVVDEGRLGVSDIALTGQEDENVAAGLAQELVDGVEDPGHLILGLPGLGGRGAGPAPALATSPLVAGRERGGAAGADGLAAGPRRGAHRRVGGGQGLQLGLAQLARSRRAGPGGGGAVSRLAAGIVGGGRCVVGSQGAVAHLNGVGAPGDLDDRDGHRGRLAEGPPPVADLLAAEVLGEALGVDGGRGDDDLEVGALGQQARQVAQDEVDVEAALVGLVHDDRVIAAQLGVGLDLRQQDAVGHELDQGVVPDLLGEAHLVADDAARPDRGAQLGGDALGHAARGDAPRLGVADHPGDAPAQLQADLGQLGGLAAAGLTGDDDDLVLTDGGGDLLAAGADRQLLGVDDRRDGGGAGGELLGGVALPGAGTPAPGPARAPAPSIAAVTARGLPLPPLRRAVLCGSCGVPVRPVRGGLSALGAACAEVAVLLVVVPTGVIVALVPLEVLALFHRWPIVPHGRGSARPGRRPC